MNYYVSIKFANAGKAYYFSSDIADLKIGDKVVAESVRGLQVGEVVSNVTPISEYKSQLELKPILRRANEDDLLIYDENKKRSKEALKIANKEIENLGLDMHPIEAEYTLDGSKLTIVYVADERVDFRELLRVLASRFHCRIDLRQIGSRDKAKMVGGIGICGLPLCCKTFLNNAEGISITRAKNQMLSLNIPKLSGHCGKLICCLLYEDDAYTELKKDFPRIGETFKKGDALYKVTGINVLSRTVKIENEEEINTISLKELKEQYKGKSNAGKKF